MNEDEDEDEEDEDEDEEDEDEDVMEVGIVLDFEKWTGYDTLTEIEVLPKVEAV